MAWPCEASTVCGPSHGVTRFASHFAARKIGIVSASDSRSARAIVCLKRIIITIAAQPWWGSGMT
jgi:hypothetical protein